MGRPGGKKTPLTSSFWAPPSQYRAMRRENTPNTKPISRSAVLASILLCLLLSANLYVYPTSLNPGLPILGGALFSTVVGFWRLLRGAGPYYHWGMDIASAYLVWMFVSSLSGLDAYLSQRSLATFISALGFLWTCQCAIKSSQDWRLMAHTFILLCTGISILAWPPAVQIAMKTGSIPPLKGVFVNPDTFSILPLLALTLAPALLERASTRVTWWLCGAMTVLFLTIIATGCRASLLGFAVGAAAAFAALATNRSASHLKKAKALLVLPLGLALLALPMSNFGLHVFGKYVETLTGEAAARQATRIEVATHGWKAVAQHPLLGAGPGCFGPSFQSVRSEGHDRLYVNIAHNDPMEVAVELGLPGAILWLTLIFTCLHKSYKLILDGRRPLAAAGMFGTVLAVTTYSLFNFVISERPVLWAELWIFGLALSFPSSRLVHKEKPLLRYLAGIVLIALGIWAAIFGYRAFQADSYVAQSQIYAQQLQTEQAIKALETAIALQPQRSTLRLRLADLERSLSAFYPGHENTQRRLSALEAARKSSPANLGVLVALSDLQVETGDFKQASLYLEEAQERAPHHVKIREKRVALAIRQGDLEKAVGLTFLDEPGRGRDDRLAALLISLELEKPGKGVATLRPYLQNIEPGPALDVLDQAVQSCLKRNLWKPGLAFSALEVQIVKDDLCSILRWVNLTGKVKGPKAEWVVLDQAMTRTAPSSDKCYGDLLETWVQHCLRQGRSDKAVRRLEEDLNTDNRLVRARVLLSQAHFESGAPNKAIALVREGLGHESRSLPLLKQLAQLYEWTGSRDLAVNYYQEALELQPKDKDLKAKISRLRKAKR